MRLLQDFVERKPLAEKFVAAYCLGSWLPEAMFLGTGAAFKQVAGCRFQGSGSRVQSAEFRVQNSGFRVLPSGLETELGGQLLALSLSFQAHEFGEPSARKLTVL